MYYRRRPRGRFTAAPLSFLHLCKHVYNGVLQTIMAKRVAPNGGFSMYVKNILGASWGTLGPSWEHLGPILEHLGASWGLLGPSWEHLGTCTQHAVTKTPPKKPLKKPPCTHTYTFVWRAKQLRLRSSNTQDG